MALLTAHMSAFLTQTGLVQHRRTAEQMMQEAQQAARAPAPAAAGPAALQHVGPPQPAAAAAHAPPAQAPFGQPRPQQAAAQQPAYAPGALQQPAVGAQRPMLQQHPQPNGAQAGLVQNTAHRPALHQPAPAQAQQGHAGYHSQNAAPHAPAPALAQLRAPQAQEPRPAHGSAAAAGMQPGPYGNVGANGMHGAAYARPPVLPAAPHAAHMAAPLQPAGQIPPLQRHVAPCAAHAAADAVPGNETIDLADSEDDDAPLPVAPRTQAGAAYKGAGQVGHDAQRNNQPFADPVGSDHDEMDWQGGGNDGGMSLDGTDGPDPGFESEPDDVDAGFDAAAPHGHAVAQPYVLPPPAFAPHRAAADARHGDGSALPGQGQGAQPRDCAAEAAQRALEVQFATRHRAAERVGSMAELVERGERALTMPGPPPWLRVRSTVLPLCVLLCARSRFLW